MRWAILLVNLGGGHRSLLLGLKRHVGLATALVDEGGDGEDKDGGDGGAHQGGKVLGKHGTVLWAGSRRWASGGIVAVDRGKLALPVPGALEPLPVVGAGPVPPAVRLARGPTRHRRLAEPAVVTAAALLLVVLAPMVSIAIAPHLVVRHPATAVTLRAVGVANVVAENGSAEEGSKEEHHGERKPKGGHQDGTEDKWQK